MSDLERSVLQPTLWRTCRALASKPRLRILQHLLLHPDQHVTQIADALGFPLPMASMLLRMLEARGILECRRQAKWVHYRFSTGVSPYAAPLVAAITTTFRTRKHPADFIFNAVTAFTHPQRVRIATIIGTGSIRRSELRILTGMSSSALSRHLNKLRQRGFVISTRGRYKMAPQSLTLPKVLLMLSQSRSKGNHNL